MSQVRSGHRLNQTRSVAGCRHQTTMAGPTIEFFHPEGETPGKANRSVRNWGWHWVFGGARHGSWIGIIGERPSVNGRLYRFDPVGDPVCHAWTASIFFKVYNNTI